MTNQKKGGKKSRSGIRSFNTPKPVATERTLKIGQMDADDFQEHKPKQREGLIIRIKKQDIDACNISSVLERLHGLTENKDKVVKYRHDVMFMVDGYDYDSRELPEVPEVRRFFALLVKEWPHWMWFLRRRTGSIALLMSLLCEVRVIHGRPGQFGTEFLDIEEVQERFKDMLDRGVVLFETYDINPRHVSDSALSAVREIMPD